MKPFIMVSTRPELEAAQHEYESFLTQSGLSRGDLQHVQLEEIDFLDAFTARDVSGVFIGGSPYNPSTPATAKTRSQLRVEDQVRDLLAVALKEGVALLATGFGLQVLAGYLGTQASEEYGEEMGGADIFLTAEGRQDPLLEGMPQAFSVFVGHHEGVGRTPEHAVLLASSPDCPVQMIRVGRAVYGTQFNPELDAARFEQHVSIYTDAGYGDPDMSEDILSKARSQEQHEAGRIIRNFVTHFRQEWEDAGGTGRSDRGRRGRDRKERPGKALAPRARRPSHLSAARSGRPQCSYAFSCTPWSPAPPARASVRTPQRVPAPCRTTTPWTPCPATPRDRTAGGVLR